jgi:hypothetical protein
MATSTSPTLCAEALDPHEELDFDIDLSPLVETNEFPHTAFALTLRPEAVLLGLKIMGDVDGRPDPMIDPVTRLLRVWMTIEPAQRNDAAFDGAGSLLPFELFFDTDLDRKRNRTFAVLVRQR